VPPRSLTILVVMTTKVNFHEHRRRDMLFTFNLLFVTPHTDLGGGSTDGQRDAGGIDPLRFAMTTHTGTKHPVPSDLRASRLLARVSFFLPIQTF